MPKKTGPHSKKAHTRLKQKLTHWSRLMLEPGKAVILDTETTGLRGEVIQLGVIDTTGQVLADTLIKPTRGTKVEKGAYDVHGIGDDMLKNAPTFEDVWRYVAPALKDKVIIAYNKKFDAARMKATLAKNNIIDPWFSAATWKCAMLVYADWRNEWNNWGKGTKWHKLTDACERHDLTVNVEAHDAVGDCLRTLGIIQIMAGQRENGSEITPILGLERIRYTPAAAKTGVPSAAAEAGVPWN